LVFNAVGGGKGSDLPSLPGSFSWLIMARNPAWVKDGIRGLIKSA